MKITMLRNRLGSNDGFTTRHYLEGEIYDVTDALAESFIADRVAEEAGDNPAPAYVVGNVYNIGEETFLAIEVDGQTEPFLKPVPELTDEQRTALIAEGKLGDDGKAVEVKAEAGAPQNKARGRAPKNKAAA